MQLINLKLKLFYVAPFPAIFSKFLLDRARAPPITDFLFLAIEAKREEFFGRERQRDREIERQRDRERDRDRDRERETERDRETERNRETERDKERETESGISRKNLLTGRIYIV